MEKFVNELFESQNLSFIGSVNEDGFPSIRAMLRPRLRDGIKTIYFSTNTPSDKVSHFENNEKACVYVCDPVKFKGALLTGTMEILEATEHRQMLWRDGDELYYPGGVNDLGYCVLKFSTISVRTYNKLQSENFIPNFEDK